MMFVTNRKALCAPATGLAFVLTLAIGAGLNLGLQPATAWGDEKSQSDLLKPFQGTWASSGEGIDATWTFDGEKVKATVAGMDYTCKVKLDASAKPHPTIDLLIDDGPEEAKGKTSKGLYKLDGEKLTLCVSAPGEVTAPRTSPRSRMRPISSSSRSRRKIESIPIGISTSSEDLNIAPVSTRSNHRVVIASIAGSLFH